MGAKVFAGALAALVLSLGAGCGSKEEGRPAASPAPSRDFGPPVAYDFASLDDRPVSLAGLKGRATVLIFIATYGDASIVQARFLKKVIKEHVPRANAAAVFLERVENRPLARMFSDKLELPFAAAMGDEASIAGKGPFAGVDTVPSVVVLDEQGREVWRKVGVAHPEEIDKALREAQSGVWGAKSK